MRVLPRAACRADAYLETAPAARGSQSPAASGAPTICPPAQPSAATSVSPRPSQGKAPEPGHHQQTGGDPHRQMEGVLAGGGGHVGNESPLGWAGRRRVQ